MRIADFLPESKKTTIDFGNGKLNVEYRPAAITATWGDEEEEEITDDDERRVVLAERLCDILVSWDAEGPLPVRAEPGTPVGSIVADGDIIPLESEALRYLPLPVLIGISNELTMDATPDPTRRQRRSRRRG